MLALIQLEHGLEVLGAGGLDIPGLLSAFTKASEGDDTAIANVMRILSAAGASRSVRKIAVVMTATPQELLASESDPVKAKALNDAAALGSPEDAVAKAIDFFASAASSLGLDSFLAEALAKMMPPPQPDAPGDTPSADS